MRLFITVCILCSALLVKARLPDLIPYRKGNLWGYCDSTKRIVIEPQWEGADFFRFGRAVVRKDGKSGIIDSLGSYVIAPQYFYMHVVGRTRFAAYIAEERAGVIDDSNRVVVPFISRWVSQESDSVLSLVINEEKAMVCDLSGKSILQGDYLGWDYGVGEASQYGLFIMMRNSDRGNFWRNSGTKMIVVDTADRQLFPGTYQWIRFVDDSLFECEVSDDSTCYYNRSGNLVPDHYTIETRINERALLYKGYIKPPDLLPAWEHWYTEKWDIESRYLGLYDQYGTEYWEETGSVPGEDKKKWR